MMRLTRRKLKWLVPGVAVLGMAGAGGSYLGALQLTGNFHTVVAGQVYRSAQPTPARIEADVKRYGIRTIINLRGENAGASWYDDEVKTSRRLGVKHVDFRMSARHDVSTSTSSDLIRIMADAPKPLLIHCNAGSDRTGLASALYIAAIEKSGETAAESQLSFRYGHLSLPFIPEYAMDRSFEACEPMLGIPD